MAHLLLCFQGTLAGAGLEVRQAELEPVLTWISATQVAIPPLHFNSNPHHYFFCNLEITFFIIILKLCLREGKREK